MQGTLAARARGEHTWAYRAFAVMVGLAVAVSALVAGAGRANAAGPGSVSGATFEWTFSDETNAASFNGQCNFWSAGQSDGTLAAYTATNGNATVLKLNAADQYVPISDYAARCLDKNGNPANFSAGAAARRLGQKVRFTGGTGTLDPATGASTIQWTGTWSINFYGTLVPFWITNPKLVVNASGAGTVTATVGGYASDINDPDVKTPLPEVSNVVIATLQGVTGANTTGFSSTPVYQNVTYDVAPESGQSPQNRTTPGWGAWPTSFVDFQMQTGLGSYWYSSGGSIDVRKPPQALTVGYGTYAAAPSPSTTATPNSHLDPSVANPIAVTGANFNGFAASESGVYVGLIAASKWQPGQVPNQADFIGTAFVPKATIVGGAFTTTVTVPANAVTNLTDSYGIGTICAHGCAVTNRAFDTFAPVTFSTITDPAAARVGSGFDYTVAPFAGVAPYTFAATTPLPAGLSINAATGRITGTPTTESVVKTTVSVTDSRTPRAKVKKQTLKFLIAPQAVSVAPSALPLAHQGIAYPETMLVAAGGIGPYKFKATPHALPKGMYLTSAGLLKGKPAFAGVFPVTVTVKDSLKFVTTFSYLVISVAPDPMVIAPPSVPSGQVGVDYAATQLSVTGGLPTYKYGVTTGSLPQGMALTATGLLKGKPRVAGAFPITVTVTDKLHATATRDYTVTVTG